MRVLSDSYKCKIDRFALKFTPNFSYRTSGISVAVQEVISSNPCLLDQAFQQVLSETRRMRDGKSDVFVKMKDLDATPVNVGGSGQCIKKFELRRAGGRNNPSDSLLAYGSANRSRCLLCRGAAQRILVCKNFDLQVRHPVPTFLILTRARSWSVPDACSDNSSSGRGAEVLPRI